MKHKKKKLLIVNCYSLTIERGASILFAILILATILAIAFGVSTLTIGEIRISREAPKSLLAYCAAEAGIERALYDDRKGGGAINIDECSVILDNGSSYGFDIKITGNNVRIISWGCYKDVKRAIEVNY